MSAISPAKTSSGVFFILFAAVLWGTTGTSQALAPTGVNPQALGALRLAVGGMVLLAIAMRREGMSTFRGWPFLPLLFAAGCIASYQITFFAGVARTGVAVGTMVAIGSSPVAAGMLDFLVRKERPGGKWVVATILAVAGCSLLSLGGAVTVDPLGIALALAAGVSYAVYTIAIKSLLASRSAEAVMAIAFCCGALLLAPFLLTSDVAWAATPRGLVVIIHLGVIATALSYRLFARGLATVPVSSAVTLSLAEPLTATILGVTILGEHITPLIACGIVLIFAGLAILAVSFRLPWRNSLKLRD